MFACSSSANTQTFYMPVKPFTAAAGKKLTVYVNGSYRDITLEKELKFEAGKITTISVPVEKLYFHDKNVDPASSNVLNVNNVTGMYKDGGWIQTWKTTTASAVTFSNSTPESLIINGKNVSAYVIGKDNATGTVTIKGKAKELIPYVPIEFYASSWNGEKAVMRVEKITGWYNMITYIDLTFDYAKLTQYMAASRITFSGLVPLEQVTYNGKKHLTILDEEPYHKRVSTEQIEALMQNFDDDKTDDLNGFKPTFNGLYAAITNPSSLPSSKNTPLSQMTSEADITAKIIFDKISNKLSGSSIGSLADLIFGSPKQMFETVANMPLEVTLSTVAKGGSEGATDNRILVWGLNSPNVK